MKLIKKEISERELMETKDNLEIDCFKYRKQCAGLMHKYSSKDESEGVTADDYHKYCYSNMVLNEYETLFHDLRKTVKKSIDLLSKRQVPLTYPVGKNRSNREEPQA